MEAGGGRRGPRGVENSVELAPAPGWRRHECRVRAWVGDAWAAFQEMDERRGRRRPPAGSTHPACSPEVLPDQGLSHEGVLPLLGPLCTPGRKGGKGVTTLAGRVEGEGSHAEARLLYCVRCAALPQGRAGSSRGRARARPSQGGAGWREGAGRTTVQVKLADFRHSLLNQELLRSGKNTVGCSGVRWGDGAATPHSPPSPRPWAMWGCRRTPGVAGAVAAQASAANASARDGGWGGVGVGVRTGPFLGASIRTLGLGHAIEVEPRRLRIGQGDIVGRARLGYCLGQWDRLLSCTGKHGSPDIDIVIEPAVELHRAPHGGVDSKGGLGVRAVPAGSAVPPN